MASVDQGASQARQNDQPFNRAATSDGRNVGPTAAAGAQGNRAADSSGRNEFSTIRGEPAPGVTYAGRSGDMAVRVDHALLRASSMASRTQTYILRRFLGWNGSTPVRWTSATNTPPQPGLTNVTIEDEILVRVLARK